MGRVHLDLHVQHRRQSAQALSAYAERVDFIKQLQPQRLDLAELGARGRLGLQFVHVEVAHQRLLGHQHGFFGGAAYAYTQHAGWAPAGAHGRHGF